MKKIILSAALIISSFAIANNVKNSSEKEPTKISEKKRIEIVNQSKQPVYF